MTKRSTNHRHNSFDKRKAARNHNTKGDITYLDIGNGKCSIIDSDDFQKAKKYTWHLSSGYARHKTKKHGSLFLHRLITNAPPSKMVDHINRDTLDNRKSNLRLVNAKQNRLNSRPMGSLSRFKGVSRNPSAPHLWRASIRVNDKQCCLGYWKDESDAALAYNIAAQLFYGEYAYLNPV